MGRAVRRPLMLLLASVLLLGSIAYGAGLVLRVADDETAAGRVAVTVEP